MAIPKKLLSRTTYPSDISRDQFRLIASLLESARKKTKPRTVDLYEVFCGVLYVLKSGCQWDMLPEDFPKWRTVYNYWQIWNESSVAALETGEMATQPSVLERVLKKISWRGPTTPWSLEDNFISHS
jgi:Putative transposase of IS4/5 family (DUF4096)